MSRLSSSPCEFVVECSGFKAKQLNSADRFLLRISWTPQTEQKAKRAFRTEQVNPLIERAAVALAALLFGKLSTAGQMRVTRAGECADYWLPRLQCALEISGTTNAREVRRRHREKVAQALANPLRWHS